MKSYNDRSGNSGVVSYIAHEDAIDVLFRDGIVYRYDHAATGRDHVERMKWLARAGRGLAGYINRHTGVREKYADKWPLGEYRALGLDRDGE
ncbi:MAG TPA: hypothetical protein VJ696_13830 [Rhodanobacteraceae bacterium]|nr:hypothetical protein [Rhodanobacteraceae bacterium]